MSNIVNISGGKDSTAMLGMMLDRGIRVDRALYADVGEMAEFDYMYEYIRKVENAFGIKIETVRSHRTARSIFYGYPSRGKHTDEIRGFPPTIGRGCRYRSWLKTEPLEAVAGPGNDVFIGFAANEIKRSQSSEFTQGKQRYHFPLIDWGKTEQDCLDYTKEIDLYNYLYDYFSRLGCFWCPKQSIKSLRQLYLHFPEQWATLRQMESDQGRPFKYNYPAYELEERFRREEEADRKCNKCLVDCSLESNQTVIGGWNEHDDAVV